MFGRIDTCRIPRLVHRVSNCLAYSGRAVFDFRLSTHICIRSLRDFGKSLKRFDLRLDYCVMLPEENGFSSINSLRSNSFFLFSLPPPSPTPESR